jgi:hypothetical protein
MLWAFAIAATLLGELVSFYVPGLFGFVLGVCSFGAGGWAAVHVARASRRRAIVAMLVAALLAAAVAFVCTMVAPAPGDGFADAFKGVQAQLTLRQQATMARAGGVAQGAARVMLAATSALIAFAKASVSGVMGCFVGGAMGPPPPPYHP